MKARFLRSVFTAIIFFLSSSHAFAVSYTITTIVDTTSTFSDFPDAEAAINNNGTVVYKGELPSGAVNIYTSASGTPVITNQTYDSEPVINDNGTVAIAMQNTAGVAGVYNGTTSSFIIDDTNSIYELFSDIAINNSDTVAFVGEFNNGADFAISKTPPLNTISDTNGPFSIFGDSDINDNGTVIYVADFDSGNTTSLYSSTSTTPIFSTTGEIFAVINNNNTIAYTDTTAIYTNTSGMILSSGTPFSSFANLAINDNNTFALSGTVAGDSAIYAYNGSSLDKVITANEFFNPTTVVIGVNIGRHAINDSGQIVFWATLVDTSTNPFTIIEGIYLATPDFLLGDINADGLINTADYLLLTQIVLGSKIPTPSETSAGDMNQDSQLNAADLILHVRTVLGLI